MLCINAAHIIKVVGENRSKSKSKSKSTSCRQPGKTFFLSSFYKMREEIDALSAPSEIVELVERSTSRGAFILLSNCADTLGRRALPSPFSRTSRSSLSTIAGQSPARRINPAKVAFSTCSTTSTWSAGTRLLPSTGEARHQTSGRRPSGGDLALARGPGQEHCSRKSGTQPAGFELFRAEDN